MPLFQAIILGNEQGRNVYKKRLVDLVQQHRLNQIINTLKYNEVESRQV